MRAVVVLALMLALTPSAIAADEGSNERVLVDLTVQAVPGASVGHCALIEPGTLVATVKIADPERGVLPVRFGMGRASNADDDPRINTMVATESVTYSIPLAGGRYCYSLYNEAAMPAQTSVASLAAREQFVSLRLVLATPR